MEDKLLGMDVSIACICMNVSIEENAFHKKLSKQQHVSVVLSTRSTSWNQYFSHLLWSGCYRSLETVSLFSAFHHIVLSTLQVKVALSRLSINPSYLRYIQFVFFLSIAIYTTFSMFLQRSHECYLYIQSNFSRTIHFSVARVEEKRNWKGEKKLFCIFQIMLSDKYAFHDVNSTCFICHITFKMKTTVE